MSSGNVRNIVFEAAYLAADDDRPVGMRQLGAGDRAGVPELGHLCLEARVGRYDKLASIFDRLEVCPSGRQAPCAFLPGESCSATRSMTGVGMRTYDEKPKRAQRTPRHSEHHTSAVDVAAAGHAVAQRRTDILTPARILHLQRTAGNAAVADMLQGERSPVLDVVKGGGTALDAGTKAQMEAAFEQDFSGVRVHTGGAASRSAASVQAHAYTVGNDIVFNDSHYAPGTDGGNRMLAHELTHVVQQRQGAVDGTPQAGGISVSDPSDRFERAAEANADRVMSKVGSTSSVQRDAAAEAAGSAPDSVLSRQMMSLQRTAGKRAVQSLVRTSAPPAHAVVIQRLAWNNMILRNDVADVKQVGTKSTFIVTGTDGNRVVFKVESSSETAEVRKARYRSTMNIAKRILPNVPQYDFISKIELTELVNLPASVTGDADLVRSTAKKALTNAQDLAVRLSLVDVGDNLEDMMLKAAPAVPGAPARPQNLTAGIGLPLPKKTAAMQLLENNPVVWRQLGSIAAFDLLVGQSDRFQADGSVNLQNLDFNSAGTRAVALDNFDPFRSMQTIIDLDEKLADGLKTKAAAKAYSDSAVAQICAQVGIVVSSDDFYRGFNDARKALRKKLLGAIDQGKKKSKKDEEPERIEYLNWIRARVKMIVL